MFWGIVMPLGTSIPRSYCPSTSWPYAPPKRRYNYQLTLRNIQNSWIFRIIINNYKARSCIKNLHGQHQTITQDGQYRLFYRQLDAWCQRRTILVAYTIAYRSGTTNCAVACPNVNDFSLTENTISPLQRPLVYYLQGNNRYRKTEFLNVQKVVRIVTSGL